MSPHPQPFPQMGKGVWRLKVSIVNLLSTEIIFSRYKITGNISFSPPFGGVGGGYEMFLNIFLKRKPLRKPLHYLIEFNRIAWLLFMLIFALEIKRQKSDSLKYSTLRKMNRLN